VVIFIALKTTGKQSDDVVVSVAILSEALNHEELINEGKKIPPQASMVHHITNEMIADAPKFHKTQAYKILQKYNTQEHFWVMEESEFVVEMLQKYGFTLQANPIDLLRVSKHLIKECELYSLQFLRYELKLYKKDTQDLGWGALADSYVLRHLYDYLKETVSPKEMVALTTQKVLLEKISFGKYSQRYIEEVVACDLAYVKWMLSLEDLDEDLRYSLQYYLEG
jgi:DNA polymerase-3 subunit epsilon/exodeoxyribonuclease X